LHFAHGQPQCWHPSPPGRAGVRRYQRLTSAAISSKRGSEILSTDSTIVSTHSDRAGKVVTIASETLDNIVRNRWSTSIGIGGQLRPEYALLRAGAKTLPVETTRRAFGYVFAGAGNYATHLVRSRCRPSRPGGWTQRLRKRRRIARS